MELSPITVGMLVVGALLILFRVSLSSKGAKKVRRRGFFHGGPGAGATGAFHEMLSEDRRKAIEIVLEEKAEARDPETADDTIDPESPPKSQ